MCHGDSLGMTLVGQSPAVSWQCLQQVNTCDNRSWGPHYVQFRKIYTVCIYIYYIHKCVCVENNRCTMKHGYIEYDTMTWCIVIIIILWHVMDCDGLWWSVMVLHVDLPMASYGSMWYGRVGWRHLFSPNPIIGTKSPAALLCKSMLNTGLNGWPNFNRRILMKDN